MSSSRFKAYLLDYLFYPIVINSSSGENSCISKQRQHSTFAPSIFSCNSNNSCISTTLDFLVSTSSYITIKLNFNGKTLFLKTLTLSTLELLIFNSAFTKDDMSFCTIYFKSSLILFREHYFVFVFLFGILFSINLFLAIKVFA